jgi:hypothetical protein
MKKECNATVIVTVLLSALIFIQEAVCAPPASGKDVSPDSLVRDTVARKGYRIDQPGTITFTVGMVIKGKVEKPQVLIFLPKEKTQFKQLDFSHSFKDELSEPLPFSPLVE